MKKPLPGFFQNSGGDSVEYRIPLDKTIYFNSEVDNGDSGTAKELDFRQGNKQRITMTDTSNLSFIDPYGPTSLILKVVQDAGGNSQINWPDNVHWPDGTVQALSNLPGAVDLFGMYFDGSIYYVNISPNFLAP